MKNLQKLMFLIALLVSGIEAKIDEVVIQNFMDVYGIADPYAEKYLRTLSHDQLNDLTQSSDNPADVKAEFEFMLESYFCEKSDKIIAPDQEVIPLQQAQAASRAEARSAESRCVKELRRLQQALAQSPVIAYFKNLFVHDSDLKFLAQSSLQENYKGGESFGNACFLDTVCDLMGLNSDVSRDFKRNAVLYFNRIAFGYELEECQRVLSNHFTTLSKGRFVNLEGRMRASKGIPKLLDYMDKLRQYMNEKDCVPALPTMEACLEWLSRIGLSEFKHRFAMEEDLIQYAQNQKFYQESFPERFKLINALHKEFLQKKELHFGLLIPGHFLPVKAICVDGEIICHPSEYADLIKNAFSSTGGQSR